MNDTSMRIEGSLGTRQESGGCSGEWCVRTIIFMYGLSPFPLILYNLGARGGRARSCRPGPLNQTIDLRYGARVGVELAVRPNVTTKPVFTKCQPRGWRKG